MESGLLLGEESGLAIVTGDKTIMNLEAAAAAIEIGSDGKVIACRSIRDDRSKKTRPYCDMALREKYAPLGPEVVNRQPRHAVRYTAFLIREARH